MTKQSVRVTAAELIARLAVDPSHVARREAIDAAVSSRAAEYRAQAAPVVLALRRAGVPVDSIGEATGVADAVPVLLEHLQKPYPAKVLWSIANALSSPAARSAWPILMAEYRKRPPDSPREFGPKDGLANALAATVTKCTIDELIALAKDPSHEDSRLLLLPGIRRSRAPQAKRAIGELASDPQLAKEIASWRIRSSA